MLDLHLFRNPSFSAASGAITLVFFAMFGTFFMLTQYFQLVMGYSALEAGVRTIPMPLTMMLAAPMSAKFVHHFGARKVVAAGLTTVGLGLLLLSRADVGTPYVLIAVSLVILASGMGLSMAPATTTIMASTPLGKAGVGSAVNDTTRELGGALGVAVLGSILASGFRSGVESEFGPLPESVQGAVTSGLGSTLAAAGDLGGEAGAQLADAARHAFADAMSNGLLVGATVALVAAAVVARYFPVHVRRSEEPDAVPAGGDTGRTEPAPRPGWVTASAEAQR
jgi:Na+/melibiose symporter-like transporter